MFKNNDNYLFQELRKGNKVAYTYLFNTYYEQLCHFIYGYTKNHKQTEDIVQDSILKVWENRDKIKPQGTVKNYIFKIAYHQFIDSYRKKKKRLELIDEIKLQYLNEFVEKDEEYKNSKKAIILYEIENLPPKCKEVFLLNKKNGLKYKEIAEELNISIKTVENHISKALKILRSKI